MIFTPVSQISYEGKVSVKLALVNGVLENYERNTTR